MKENYVGMSMKEMSEEEMREIYGARKDEIAPQSISLSISFALSSFAVSYLTSAATRCGKDNK